MVDGGGGVETSVQSDIVGTNSTNSEGRIGGKVDESGLLRY